MQDYAVSERAKLGWAATNPDKAAVHAIIKVPNPKFMRTCGPREDIKKPVRKVGLMLHPRK